MYIQEKTEIPFWFFALIPGYALIIILSCFQHALNGTDIVNIKMFNEKGQVGLFFIVLFDVYALAIAVGLSEYLSGLRAKANEEQMSKRGTNDKKISAGFILYLLFFGSNLLSFIIYLNSYDAVSVYFAFSTAFAIWIPFFIAGRIKIIPFVLSFIPLIGYAYWYNFDLNSIITQYHERYSDRFKPWGFYSAAVIYMVSALCIGILIKLILKNTENRSYQQ